MELTRVRRDARDWPQDQLEALFRDGFPPFIVADVDAERMLPEIGESFADLDVFLLDGDGVVVAGGWGVALGWDESVEDLPTGYTDSLRRALRDRADGRAPDTFVLCAGIVRPDRHGRGLAADLVTSLCDLAEERGLAQVIAPVRPTLKPRYPLTPIDEYVTWTREDGSPLDPWLRTHLRIGGRILATAPRSQVMTGTVAQWEGWCSMAFPASGDYVIPDGLSVLTVDRDQDLGTYVEPNVWVRHR
ncbi:MAG: hypothetical protein R2737_15645 [Candidatus Nanopelagicales bacterium]